MTHPRIEKTAFLALLLAAVPALAAQAPAWVESEVKAAVSDLTALRHKLHAMPELGNQEVKTQAEIVRILKEAGIETNADLTKLYTDYRADRPVVGMWAQDWTLPEPEAAQYSDDLLENAKAFSDTAMVVITRVGGEGADLPTDVSQVTYDAGHSYNDFEAGEHYLQLSKTEKDMVDLVCKNFDTRMSSPRQKNL